MLNSFCFFSIDIPKSSCVGSWPVLQLQIAIIVPSDMLLLRFPKLFGNVPLLNETE